MNNRNGPILHDASYRQPRLSGFQPKVLSNEVGPRPYLDIKGAFCTKVPCHSAPGTAVDMMLSQI
jgi:hypothetical protein